MAFAVMDYMAGWTVEDETRHRPMGPFRAIQVRGKGSRFRAEDTVGIVSAEQGLSRRRYSQY